MVDIVPPKTPLPITKDGIMLQRFRDWTQAITRVINLNHYTDVPREVSGDFIMEVAEDMILVDASAGSVTITLPPATDNAGQTTTIKKIDSTGHSVIVAAAGTDLIDGQTSQTTVVQWVALMMKSSNTAWFLK